MKKKNPEMLVEVWKMKEKVYKDTKNMSIEDIFNYVNKKTNDFLSYNKKKVVKK